MDAARETSNVVPLPPRRICIVRLSALGDITLVLPTIHSLRHAFPHSEISWIIGCSTYGLVKGLPGVNFIPIQKPSTPRDLFNLHHQLRDHTFDVVLAMQASLRTNLIYPLLRAPRKIGFDAQRGRDGHGLFVNERIPFAREHLLDSFFAFAHALGVQHKRVEFGIPLSEDELAFGYKIAYEARRPLLAINAAASRPERNWTVEGYVDTLRAAQSRWDAHVVLTGSNADADRELGDTITSHLTGPYTNLIGRTTPKQLASILKSAKCLLAPDTGPTHIAVAVGTPVVGLYAVAPPELSGPYLYPHLVVNKFPEAVATLLGKDPATVPWGTRVHDPRAMALIKVDDVIAKLALVFDAPNTR